MNQLAYTEPTHKDMTIQMKAAICSFYFIILGLKGWIILPLLLCNMMWLLCGSVPAQRYP